MSATPFKRAYKACDRCRKNKSKCELHPNGPGCTRCIREQKECVFPTHRSTKRVKTVDKETQNDSAGVQINVSSTSVSAQRDEQPPLPSAHPIDERESVWQATGAHVDTYDKRDCQIRSTIEPGSNLENQVLTTFVTTSRDAIDLLFRAAEQQDSENSEEQLSSDHGFHEDIVGSMGMPSPGLASSETLNLWSQHRFVRQGWFTPLEAVAYVTYFFQNISALSPVSDSYYADQKNHKHLILEEPLLCCTILMIASRFHVPSREGGRPRSDFVHNRLWRHVEHLIQRITFGAEKYSLAKTRTLGSIQALLLIIEWHPRAIHFPPENDGWDASLAPSLEDDFQQDRDSQASRRWREDVFEPAKRSDRMSWMLVGVAVTLGHELGIFSDEANMAQLRIRRLLFVYTSQLSLRLGCTNVFPSQQNISHISADDQAGRDREMLVTKWIEITRLMTTTTEMLFPNRALSRQIFKMSRYTGLLEHFEPLLKNWHTDFERLTLPTVSRAARLILLVEYHFVRMYINSIAVQALVERETEFGQDLLTESSSDFRFVKEVRNSSMEILQTAVQLSEASMLHYCPVRFFLRVVAASIYLLKAISLGSRETDITRSLGHLESCITVLQTHQADDIHLSSRYATLIARHVRHFKKNFQVKRRPPFSRAPSHGLDVNSEFNLGNNGDDFMEDWLAQPFNAQFAPFGTEGAMPVSGLAIDSLDFLWNMTT